MLRDGVALLSAVKQGAVVAYTSSLVLSEINWTLASFYRFGKADVIRSLGGIVELANLRLLDDTDPPFALDLFRRHNVKWVDCLIASSPGIRSGEAAVVSYDRDFDRLGVHRLEPSEVAAD